MSKFFEGLFGGFNNIISWMFRFAIVALIGMMIIMLFNGGNIWKEIVIFGVKVKLGVIW